MATSAPPLSLEERRRRRDARRGAQAGGESPGQGTEANGDAPLALPGPVRSGVAVGWVQAAVLLFIGAGLLALGAQMHPPLRVVAAGLWAGLLLGGVAGMALAGKSASRWQTVGMALFGAVPLIALPVVYVVWPFRAWESFGLLAAGSALAVSAVVRTLPLIEEARRERKLAAERGELEEFSGITLEWSLLAALSALAIAVFVGDWQRHTSLAVFGAGVWAGLWLGGVLAHAALSEAEIRGRFLAQGLFAALPLIAIPVRYFVWPVAGWMQWLGALVAAALAATALRLVLHLAQARTAAAQPEPAERETAGKVGPVLSTWFHDALMKSLAGFFLILAGALAIVYGHQREIEQPVWIGSALIALVGSVGLWTPGVFRRPPRLHAFRSVGQIAFWFSLLGLPFLEVTPKGTLPFVARPTVHLIGAGLGLVLMGATWFLQGSCLLSPHSEPERKHFVERALSFALVVAGLAATLAGVELRQRDVIRIDRNAFSQTNIVGTSRFAPIDQVKALRIVQPFEPLPIYTDFVELNDGTTFRLDSQIYPGQDAVVTAIRTAAKLNIQSFPQPHVEQWTKTSSQ